MSKNYYEILNISRNATENEIRKAYKDLVKKYHPDLYIGDKDFAEQKIKQINEAYDFLSDPEKKAEYDEYLNSLSNPTPTQAYSEPINQTPKSTYSTSTKKRSSTPVTDFVSKKIDLLSHKRQIQVFILILLISLILFLLNLFELKNYLSEHSEESLNTYENTVIPSIYEKNTSDITNSANTTNSTNTNNTTNVTNSTSSKPPTNNYLDSYNSIDEFLYDYFDHYFDDYMEPEQNSEY